VGFNLFVLQGLTKRDIGWIAKVSLPMFFLMFGFVLLLWFVPGLATWLPSGVQG
jgi:TRAP-type C4-dicarboxylate transport system permease large subunit